MKKTLWLCLLVCVLALPVSAHTVPDLTQQGSIRVTMRDQGSAVPGGELTLYRVGDIAEDDGNYSFIPAGRFATADVSLQDVQSPQTARKLADFAKKQMILGQTEAISSKGTAAFEDLQPGLYLLVQKKAAEGYCCANPFLVSLPMQTGGEYVYRVDASPKVSPVPVPDPENPAQPETGQPGWPIRTFFLSGAALILLLRRRKAA